MPSTRQPRRLGLLAPDPQAGLEFQQRGDPQPAQFQQDRIALLPDDPVEPDHGVRDIREHAGDATPVEIASAAGS